MNDINNWTEEEQIKAIARTPYFIGLIKNPSEKMKLIAVTKYGDAIKYIKEPSEAVQLAAVRESGYNIRYINNPSEEVQLESIKEKIKITSIEDEQLFNYLYKNSHKSTPILMPYKTIMFDEIVDEHITSPKALKLYEKLKTVSNIII